MNEVHIKQIKIRDVAVNTFAHTLNSEWSKKSSSLMIFVLLLFLFFLRKFFSLIFIFEFDMQNENREKSALKNEVIIVDASV